MLIAESLGFDIVSRNAMFDQEALDPVDTPLGKGLVVDGTTARICVTLENQVRRRTGAGLIRQILREV